MHYLITHISFLHAKLLLMCLRIDILHNLNVDDQQMVRWKSEDRWVSTKICTTQLQQMIRFQFSRDFRLTLKKKQAEYY